MSIKTKPNVLTKDKLTEKIREETAYQKKEAVNILETLSEIIKQTLANGEDVLISGFGKFCVRDKKARRGRNPASGESMVLDARRVVTFKCSRGLREKINQA